ncbi:MAG: aminotransferase DegT, partial [Deltaproteobacteria bacterium]
MNRKLPTLSSFEPGAPAAEGFIPLSIPKLAGNEWRYVRECLDTNWVSSVGAFVERFEREVAARVGARYGVATASGTAAIHIALLVSGVGPGDEVLLPTLTFIAPANAIRYVGAVPLLLDVDPVTWQLDPEKTIDFLEKECRWQEGRLVNRTTGRRVRAIMPVHILGHPVDLDPILEVARKYELTVIEDATESLGARYKERHVGNLGDIGCFSFNGNKIITSGGGGMIVTNDETTARRARYLTTQAKDDPIEYVHGELGYNYRLTNLQAALGVAQ